ncbi:MAG TPA: dUTP diphosphatase [Firmicutes bacterium]|nr:dUTP diphosphatase [Bacillota bacterium]
MILHVKKLREDAVLPVRATEGSAGMDLHALVDAPVALQPGERAMVPTGLAIALPSPEYVALIFARSGLAVKKGVTLSNCVGVIDSDYRGELKIGLINQSKEAYTIEKGERIAQLVIMPVCLPQVVEAENLDETDRGAGGFGSTGK